MIPLYAEFAKIDVEQRMVFGYASTEKRDHQGETVLKSAIEGALPEYIKFRNIREMHQASAVGTADEITPDMKGLWIGAKIVDDRAWAKVQAKVYKGFSIGGRVTSRDPVDKSIITGLSLSEISLVDRPANPEALFEMYKSVDGKLLPQPVQKWDCGIAAHQHYAKVDAATCMEHEIAKATPHLNSGKFGSNAGVADEHNHTADGHAADAATARKTEAKHRRLATQARNKHDAAGVAIHEHIAGAQASLADSHEQAMTNHRALASRHAQAAKSDVELVPSGDILAKNNSAKEFKMTVRTVADAEKAATAAVALLTASFGKADDATNHRQDADDALKSATTHSTAVEVAMKKADEQRVASEDKDPTKAALAKAAAIDYDASAINHLNIANGYFVLHNHHATAFAAQDKKAGADICKAGGELCTGLAGKYTAAAEAHTALAAKAIEAKDQEAADHHTATAKAYQASADAIKGLADGLTKAMGDNDGDTVNGGDTDGDSDDNVDQNAVRDGPGGGARAGSDGGTGGNADDSDRTGKGMTTKCAKCGATMPAGNEKCQSCGTPIGKVDDPTAEKDKATKVAAYGSVANGIAAMAQLSAVLAHLDDLQLGTAMDQVREGNVNGDALYDAMDKVVDLIQGILFTETLVMLKGENEDSVLAEANTLYEATAKEIKPWASAFAAHLRDATLVNKLDKKATKQLIEKCEKIGKQSLVVTGDAAAKIAEVEVERDSAVKALDTVTRAVEGMARDVQKNNRDNKELRALITKQQGQIKTLEDQPQPSRAHGINVRKVDDNGGGDEPTDGTFLAKVASIQDPVERAQFILRQGYTGHQR